MVFVEYEMNSRLNFLFDYSKYLIENRKYDQKIAYWQVENSFILKKFGLDTEFLKSMLEVNNKKYYKFENLMNQISYRLEKHGKLAPTREIGRKINENQIEENFAKEGDGQNPDEINFYNLNDPFIDDEEVFVSILTFILIIFIYSLTILIMTSLI
jgi:hypothetical protein